MSGGLDSSWGSWLLRPWFRSSGCFGVGRVFSGLENQSDTLSGLDLLLVADTSASVFKLCKREKSGGRGSRPPHVDVWREGRVFTRTVVPSPAPGVSLSYTVQCEVSSCHS